MKRRCPRIGFVHSPWGLGQEDLPLKHLPNTFQPIFSRFSRFFSWIPACVCLVLFKWGGVCRVSSVAGDFSCDTWGTVQARKIFRAGLDGTLLRMMTSRGKKPHFDLTPPVNIREKQSLENPSPQKSGSLVETENNTLLMNDQQSNDLIWPLL